MLYIFVCVSCTKRGSQHVSAAGYIMCTCMYFHRIKCVFVTFWNPLNPQKTQTHTFACIHWGNVHFRSLPQKSFSKQGSDKQVPNWECLATESLKCVFACDSQRNRHKLPRAVISRVLMSVSRPMC